MISLNLIIKDIISYNLGYDYGMSYDSGGGGGGGGFGKEMTLKKVYELALTAIAYLAFGIFVLQVIMCITTVCQWIRKCDSVAWLSFAY